MAESMFFCSRREIAFLEVSQHSVPPYVDAFSLPYLPPYDEVFCGDNVFLVSSDSQFVYDIQVPCTYASKRWKLDEIAQVMCRRSVPISRRINYLRDGYLALADRSCLVQIAKGALLGLRSYYSYFERCDDHSSHDVTQYIYDQRSRVGLSCYQVRGGVKYFKVITNENRCDGNNEVVPREMVRPFMGSWVTVCKGKDQDFLCVVTESPRYARRDLDLLSTDLGHPEYYDEVDGVRDGEPYSVLSQTSLLIRRCGDRESIGIGLMSWSKKQGHQSEPQYTQSMSKRAKRRKPRRAKLRDGGTSSVSTCESRPVQVVTKHLDLG